MELVPGNETQYEEATVVIITARQDVAWASLSGPQPATQQVGNGNKSSCVNVTPHMHTTSLWVLQGSPYANFLASLPVCILGSPHAYGNPCEGNNAYGDTKLQYAYD